MIKVFYNVLGVILAIIGVVLLYYSTNFLIQYYSIDCVVAPNDYVISNENVLDANEFGDYFGGIMNPLIGLTAAFITFLAFFIQFLANRQITSQFQIQQFESQFYEMLKLHKENVNEIEITVKNTVVNNTGNKEIILSGTTAKYFKHDLKFIKSSQDSYKTLRGRDVFRVMKNEFEIYLSEAKTLKGNCLEGEDFEAVYELFFWGVRSYARSDKRSLVEKLEPSKFINKLYLKVEAILNDNNIKDKSLDFFSHENLNEIVLGIGYAGYLGHYYRHLFQTVKFVADNKFFNHENKMNYLRILRGQLSNYEQIMLFYNWLGSYGHDWEDKKHKYFSKYKMIHNLWYRELLPNCYTSNQLKDLVKSYESLKSSNSDFRKFENGKTLFESKDDI